MDDQTKTLFIMFFIVFILLNTPIIGKYIAIMHTLIHEIGHALMALLTGGHISKIKLFANTEGEAWSQNNRVGQIITTIAGYPFASCTSVLLLYLLKEQHYTYIMTILIGIVILSVLFWIRNLYGLLWIISFGFILYWVMTTGDNQLTNLFITFIVSVIYIEAIQKAFVILMLSLKQPRDAGDATILMKSTWIIPAQIWGLAFFTQALVFAYYGLHWFI